MKWLSITGWFFLLGAFGLFIAKSKCLKVEQEGDIVQMQIEKKPDNCLGTKISHYATFNYQREHYIKRISAVFCNEHNVGDLVDMKVLGGSSVILFPEESIEQELWLAGGLGLFGIILLVRAGFSKRKRK
jgi:hypothetical protein